MAAHVHDASAAPTAAAPTAAAPTAAGPTAAAPSPEVIRDPVCGMTVDPAAGKPSHDHGGRTFHFCCRRLPRQVRRRPGDYLTATRSGLRHDGGPRQRARTSRNTTAQRFYFCSAGCKGKFEADPAKYLGDRPAPEPMPGARSTPARCIPRSSSDGPGDCPICGMALEPMGVPAGDEGPNPELVDFTPPLRGRRGADPAAAGR